MATANLPSAKIEDHLKRGDEADFLIKFVQERLNERQESGVGPIFSTDHVVFIVATNSDQLQHSIRAVYGENFDSQKYLFRFFDRSYKLPRPDVSDLVGVWFEKYGLDPNKFSSPPDDNHVQFISDFFKHCHLEPRDMYQCFDILRTFYTAWDFDGLKIELVWLLPLIILYQQGKPLEEITAFVLGGKHIKIDGSWTVLLHVPSRDGDSSRPDNRTVFSIIEGFRRSLQCPLSEVYRNHNGVIPHWEVQRISEEFRYWHGKRFPTDKMKSILESYKDMVITAGRFTSQNHRRDE